MTKAIVLGAGMVGRVIAADLAEDPAFSVTIADVSEDNLAQAAAHAQGRAVNRITTTRADLSDAAVIKRLVEPFDIVLGALASHIGLNALRAVIEAGKDFCDISFMAEDALELDALAKEHSVTAVVDCGVAPGMSNLLAAHGARLLDTCDTIDIVVGGLPVERTWPFEYKAGFSPADVIEEYVRPARYVVNHELVTREALSEPELIDFAGIGTLEAFNTDGLRSLADTLDVPNMKEKTLRYPGHIELMRVLRETGLFSHDPIEAGGVKVRPIDVISALMFPKWTYEEGEADLTVMRVAVDGTKNGAPAHHQWDLLDYFDPETKRTSMARTTAFPCAIIARKIAAGEIDQPGVNPPEKLAHIKGLVDHVLAEHERRGVVYQSSLPE
jgi:saccharopine dehydrogenase-like NADP-dependent oxidoreductase